MCGAHVPQKSGKYFLGKHHVKLGHFVNFSGKSHVKKFGNFANFSYTYFLAKCLLPFPKEKLTKVLRLCACSMVHERQRTRVSNDPTRWRCVGHVSYVVVKVRRVKLRLLHKCCT